VTRLVCVVAIACACGSREAPPAPPAIAHIAPADAQPPVVPDADTWSHDACNGVEIAAADRERAMLWSCLGVALDLPPGIAAANGYSDMDGLIVELDGGDRLAARVVAERLVGSADAELASIGPPDSDFTPSGPVVRTHSTIQRSYRDPESRRVAVIQDRVLDDRLHVMHTSITSESVSLRELQAAAAPLLRIRAMTAAEIAEAAKHATIDDWDALLVDKLLAIDGHEVVLCRDGRYRLDRPWGDLAAQGRWRRSHDTLELTASKRAPAVGGLYHDNHGIRVGPFGSTATDGPFPDAGDRCKR
jgi:hypothetical protein